MVSCLFLNMQNLIRIFYFAVAMVLGIDDENGPKLFKCDPAGHFFGHKVSELGF